MTRAAPVRPVGQCAEECPWQEMEFRKAILAAMPGIVYLFNDERRLVRWNANLERVTGYTAHELRGRYLEDFFDVSRSERIRNILAETYREGAVNVEGKLRTKDGEQVPYLFTVHKMPRRGRTYLLGVGIDIGARVEAERAHRRLADILDVTPDGVLIVEADGRLIYANDALQRLTGVGPDLIDSRLVDLLPDWAVEQLSNEILPATSRHGSWTGETALKGPSGEVPVSVVVLAHYDEPGVVRRYSAIARDISEQRQAEHALAASEKRYRMLYDDLPAMFFSLSLGGTLLAVNRFGAERLGQPAEALVGKPLQAFLLGEQNLGQQLEEAAAANGEVHRWELCFRRSDERAFWVRVNARSVEHENERQLLLVCEDITRTRELTRELAYHATHDPLTGLFNRSEFERRLALLLEDAKRNHTHHTLCYIDLDQFKVINDTSGHVAGDELLRQLSTMLGQEVGHRDLLARVGGDEFGLLLEGRGLDDTLVLLSRLRDLIESFQFAWGERRFRLAVSIGVVLISSHSKTATDLLRQADLACYAAKEEGRNRIHVYHPEDRVLVRRHGEMEWVAQIPRALDDGRFRLYAQPIEALGDSTRVQHYEVLLRMVNEQGQIISPGAFLPAAERYGLAVLLDRWVVDEALAWLRQRQAAGRSIEFCSINLSGHSVGDADFRRFLLERLKHGGIAPESLCFEITETAAISDFQRALALIEALKACGCRLALDDFGTGLSSYSYLKHLPVDYLKIDGIFVRDIATDPIDRAFVRSIHEVGHAMGMQTIAEFAESEAVLRELREIGVDFAQGYGIGRPQPITMSL